MLNIHIHKHTHTHRSPHGQIEGYEKRLCAYGRALLGAGLVSLSPVSGLQMLAAPAPNPTLKGKESEPQGTRQMKE